MNEKQRWSKTTVKNRRDTVIQDVRSEVDNKRFLRGVQPSKQGRWTNWKETLQKSITRKDLWQMTPLRLSFLICSTYDQISSKNSLFKWKKESDPTCPLCNDKPQTLEYVLSSCKTALGNWRCTWRHNSILDELAKFIKNYMKSKPTTSTQKFVSEKGKICDDSKQTIKHKTIPGQNRLGPSGKGGYLPTYLDGIMITQKQNLVKIWEQILFTCQGCSGCM